MKQTLLAFFMGLTLLTTSCAQLETKKENPIAEQNQHISTPIPHEDLTPEMLYYILKAEIALYNSNYDAALNSYSWVIENTEDYRVIRRATRIALGAKHNLLAMKSINRWLEIDANNPEAIQLAVLVSIRLGKTEEALKHLDNLLKQSTTNNKDNLFNMLANTLKGEPDQAQTIKSLRELAQKHQNNAYIVITLAELEQKNQQYEAAQKNISKALKINPDWQRAQILRAQNLFALGQYDAAIKQFRSIITTDPDNPQPRIALARALLSLNDIAAALEQLKKIITLSPDNHEIILYTIPLLISSEQYDTADKYIEQLLTQEVAIDAASFHMGVLKLNQKKTELAKQWFTKVNQGQYFFEAKFRLAQIIYQEGDSAEARAILKQLRTDYPEQTAQILLFEAELLKSSGQLDQAIQLISESLKDDPNNIQLLYNRAMLAAEKKSLPMLEQDLRKVIELEPTHAHALNALGYTLADETDRYTEAKQLIEKAYALLPNDSAIIDSMGWVLFKLGDYDNAKIYLLQAMKIRKDPEIASHLGQLLIAMGKKKEAKEFLLRVLDQFPENEIITNILNQLQEQPSKEKQLEK